MKEAELMRESLRKPWHDEKANADMLNTSFIRDRTLSVMLDMLDECSSVGEPTGYDLVTYYSAQIFLIITISNTSIPYQVCFHCHNK